MKIPNKYRVLAIGGVAQAGKDTLFKDLSYLLKELNPVRFALADELKADLINFFREKIGISPFTIDPKEKEIIRDILVAYGKVKRKQSQGTYWTGLLTPKIEESILDGCLPIVTDIRYDVYPTDELYWVKNVVKGVLIHVSRTDKNGQIVAPPNLDEKENDPKIQKAADFKLVWPTCDNPEIRYDFITKQLGNLFIDLYDKDKGT